MSESTSKKIHLASDWLAGCSGCHMSILDMDERLIELLSKVELTSSPLTDLKHPSPEGVDIGILEGAVNSSATEETARLMRARSKLLVALGDCAVFGGVPAMRNSVGIGAAMQRAYLECESTVAGILPADKQLAVMQPVRPLNQVVAVDICIPGCPPSAETIYYVLQELIAGRKPELQGKYLDWH